MDLITGKGGIDPQFIAVKFTMAAFKFNMSAIQRQPFPIRQ